MDAAATGTDMRKLIRKLIRNERERREREAREAGERGRRLVEGMTGRATSGMTTDEIMALTRSEE